MNEREKRADLWSAGDDEASPQATALYLVEMISQLEATAGASRFEMLAYLLSLARTEAQDIVCQVSHTGSLSKH